jgi:cell division protein FtsQ
MRPLIARRHARPRRAPIADPAPSRWAYRVQRLWLTPLFRGLMRVGLPLGCVVALGAVYVADPANRQAMSDAVQEIRREIEDRPEFRVNVLGIDGASPAVAADIRAALSLSLPVSSFDLDLDAMRRRVEALPAVASADLRIQSGGYLALRVRERVPVAVWRTRSATVLIDEAGQFVADLDDRALAHPLPLIAGEGAEEAVAEALALHAAAAPIRARVHGLVRMGERRWDVVLTDGRRILLPEADALTALDRALALHDVTDILNRDILRLDLRNPDRVSVQLSPAALEEMRRLRELELHSMSTSGERRG